MGWLVLKILFLVGVIGAYAIVLSFLGDGALSLVLKVWLAVAVIAFIGRSLLRSPQRRL
jgi:hypothetical protein